MTSWSLTTEAGLVATWTPDDGLFPAWLADKLPELHQITPTGPTEATTTALGAYYATLEALERLGEHVAHSDGAPTVESVPGRIY